MARFGGFLVLALVFACPGVARAADTSSATSSSGEKDADTRLVGNCALILKFRDWNDRAVIPIDKAEEGYDFELGNASTFTYMQAQPDGTEKQHRGITPLPLRKNRIRVEMSRDRKIGWPLHEEVTVELSLLSQKGHTPVEGPFKAAVIRKFGEVREATEDLPFVSGSVRVSGDPLEFRFGCSKALGT